MNVFRHGKNPWVWLAAGLLAVLARGLWLEVMDVDAAQYASISMEMMQNGSWLQVKHRYTDYLDKPPLLFWSSALSFLFFGLHTWAYKLPSVLAALGGVYAVYRFSQLFYTEKTARQAAFILASSTGFIVLCNDVRTDTLLLGASALASWQVAEYLQNERWKNLLAAFVWVGFAMLAKGPIGLVAPALATGSHLLLQRDFRNIFRWQWLAGLGITALILLPMCWGLYTQFDLHPEKPLNDRISTSGLYFYFWEQSFGRITGNNVWRNNAGPFYFFHVYLWAFLPWALLIPAALWFHGRKALRKIFYSRQTQLPEAFSLGGFLLLFVALSMSRYKLPHYIFVTLPWASVLIAAWLNAAPEQNKTDEKAVSIVPRAWIILSYITFLLALAIVFLLIGFVFPGNIIAKTVIPGANGTRESYHILFGNIITWGMLLTGVVFLIYRIIRNPFRVESNTFVQRGVLVSLIIGFILNFYFYPNLLPYQSTSTIGRFIHEQGLPKDKIAFFRRHGHALDFYSQSISQRMDSAEHVRQSAHALGEIWVYTNQKGKAELDAAGISYEMVYEMGHFQAALLHARFLNPGTRTQSLEPVWLLRVSDEG